MELTPYRTERGTLQRQMNRLLDDFFGDSSWPSIWTRADWAPAMDISETPEDFVVVAEVPGVDRKDLEISVTGNTLTLKGEKHQESAGNAHRVERTYGTFTRTISLPGSVDSGQVTANLKEGVLTIRIGKKEESKPRTIDVKVD